MSEQDQDVFEEVAAEDLRCGDTIQVGTRRYTVDHIEHEDAARTVVHTTTNAKVVATKDGHKAPLVRVTNRGIPARGVERDDSAAGRVVNYWSGFALPRPAVLVERRDLQRGDLFQSSHGYKLVFTDRDGLMIRGQLHKPGGVERTECYDVDSTVPVYFEGDAQSDALVDRVRAAEKGRLLASVVDIDDDQQGVLEELVHDQASQLASDALNAGRGVDFLLEHGWTAREISERLAR